MRRIGDVGLISDDAPQFKRFGFVHGLCWVHGERKIDRLIPLTVRQRKAKELAQSTFWEIYQSLQAYRQAPSETAKESIEAQFDQRSRGKTGYPDLNAALQLLHEKCSEFLAVLEYPHLPLHHNLSENEIREYAHLRKIRGGTRSDEGRRCRDTFMSLKKACRKLSEPSSRSHPRHRRHSPAIGIGASRRVRSRPRMKSKTTLGY